MVQFLPSDNIVKAKDVNTYNNVTWVTRIRRFCRTFAKI